MNDVLAWGASFGWMISNVIIDLATMGGRGVIVRFSSAGPMLCGNNMMFECARCHTAKIIKNG